MLNIDELLPTAKDIRKQSALKEAEKADEHMRLTGCGRSRKAGVGRRTQPNLRAFRRTKRSSALRRSSSAR